MRVLPAESVRWLSGFGNPAGSAAYVFEPRNVEELRYLLASARTAGKQAVLRGSGRSYGAPSVLSEGLAISLAKMNRFLGIEDGIALVEGGATLSELWRASLPRQYWPEIVSGTALPTVAGAISMNIHGKNAFKAGTYGEQLVGIELLRPNGELVRMSPTHPEFWAVVGGAGLFGIVVRAWVRVHSVPSGGVQVHARSIKSLSEQFEAFREFSASADYMVSWVDCFGGGRGLFHAANYAETKIGFDPAKQLPAGRIGKVMPRDQAWKLLKPFTNKFGIRMVNAVKYGLGRALSSSKPHVESLAAFNFLLDSMPGWEQSYGETGLMQIQIFVTEDRAELVFGEVIEMQNRMGLVSFLGVMKKHKSSPALLDYSVDGYSLAMDFPRSSDPRLLQELGMKIADFVIASGGKFYLAKDDLLTPAQFEKMHGIEAVQRFKLLREIADPERLLSSELAKRLNLA